MNMARFYLEFQKQFVPRYCSCYRENRFSHKFEMFIGILVMIYEGMGKIPLAWRAGSSGVLGMYC